MSAADWSAWASVPWTPVVTDATTTTTTTTTNVIGWRKQNVPYIRPGGASLQTLDVWLPLTLNSSTAPDASSLPRLPGSWIVYIHSGAWCDPDITSAAIAPAARHLLSSQTSVVNIAGIASINYRLSPRASAGDGDDDGDLSYAAKHPDHIADVLSGIAFLQRLGGAKSPYVLAGHSCGATLAFQAVMDASSRWGVDVRIGKPAAVVGCNGLYDLAGFIAHPPVGYEGLRDGYESFTRNAFGDDVSVWKTACPATADGEWLSEWTTTEGNKRVVLVQSKEDTLVPYQQLETMRRVLEGQDGGGVEMREMQATGNHDDLWLQGARLAEILREVVGGLR
ncbi:Alpha/Beta hydrolase protein [Podospora didyma]|uniref:Kynurenine formamidase n=1 Tax=Podospora didyma TaxID=330526 RepID=A0AAE0NRZ2_9PEZI|nr:Alpha/Beta hydrolase protein [Podospora didyma]